MGTKLVQYTVALTVFVAAATSYHFVVTPLLEPPMLEVIGVGDDSVLEMNQSVMDLFPEEAWQRGLCKQLQTADGMLLFQSWEQVENDQWRLWPVTVIIGRGLSGDSTAAPILLEAEQGAEIKFTESLDVMSGGAPPIQRGRMIGNVRLHRPNSENPNQKLEVLTSNVGIDSQKIWTTDSIEMTLGSTRIMGRDLTIQLDGPSHPGEKQPNTSTVLDRMELIYLDELVMPLKSGSMWGQAAAGEEVPNTDEPEKPALISVTCGGRVEYDFALDHLSLRDDVSLLHRVEGGSTDRFDCDTIHLALNDPMNGAMERNSPVDWITSIKATGSPVVANLSTFDADFAAERIDLNVKEGLIEASGSKGVQLRKELVTARLAKLQYRFNPSQPKELGVVDAAGAGIVQFDDPSSPVRRAQWRQGIKLLPKKLDAEKLSDAAKSGDLNRIEEESPDANLPTHTGMPNIDLWIEGDVLASMSDGGDFRAESISGIFTPSRLPQYGNRYIPDRFEISGNVKLNTMALGAEAEKVLLFFVEQEGAEPVTTQASSDSPLRQWVVQPQVDSSPARSVAKSRPTLRGESIRAQLAIRGAEVEAKKLSVMGNVEVVHEIKTGTQVLPTKLTGDHLQLIDGGGEDVLQLTSRDGVPARLELGDGYFLGPQIQIRPNENLIWMNAAGEFQLPRAAIPLGGTQEGDTGFRWGKTPYCRWEGEMIFDGQTAVLSDGVVMNATLIRGPEVWELELTGDRLQAELDDVIEVEDVRAMRKASVRTITLMQSDQRPVFIQATHRGLDGVMEARHLLNVQMMTLKPQAGGLVQGNGPGWYRGWVIPKPDQPLLSRNGGGADFRVDLNDRPITGAHLVFYDSMLASFEGRQLEFNRGIRIGVKPVEGWDSVFDARKMDAISSGESTLDCDRLRFNLDPQDQVMSRIAGASARWEMSAVDGVVFRTRNEQGLLEGNAARASYSSSKDLFTVEGAPNKPAVFRQVLPDGSPGPEGAVRSMTVRPGTMKVENAVIERLNLATPGVSSGAGATR